MGDSAHEKTTLAPLHVCPACGSQLVQPTRWQQEPGCSQWRLHRRCPECEWISEGIHGEVEIDAYDEQLEIGSHELDEELLALEHANMSEMASAFVIALDSDLISADDFG